MLRMPPHTTYAITTATRCLTHLFPSELASLGRASPPRLVTFAAGRHAARRALRSLGEPATPIPRGKSGAPVWPTGFTGSITHTGGFAAAIVGLAEHWAGLGIDAVPEGHATLTPEDIASTARELGITARCTPSVALSLKEAALKCLPADDDLSSLLALSLETVRIDNNFGTAVLTHPRGTRIEATFQHYRGIVLSIAAMPPHHHPPTRK